jgi:hypothetical protein
LPDLPLEFRLPAPLLHEISKSVMRITVFEHYLA